MTYSLAPGYGLPYGGLCITNGTLFVEAHAQVSNSQNLDGAARLIWSGCNQPVMVQN